MSGRVLAAAVPGRSDEGGAVVLLTGLPGAGKSTLARRLCDLLRGVDPRVVTLLDGDEVRRVLSADLGFSRSDRELSARRIGWAAALASRHGGVAVCAVIAPYASARAEVRGLAESVGRYLLVHVSTPLDVCESRDPKGLYARARSGELRGLTGVDDPYEPPVDADLVIDTSSVGVDEAVDAILAALHDGTGAVGPRSSGRAAVR